MLLRPIHITSNSNSDFKDEGSGLSASGPEAEYGAETSYCNKPQESTIIRDCTVQKPGQSSTSLTDSQNQNKEFNDGPNKNRLLITTNEQHFEKKSILWSCKQKLSFISLFKNPFFCIITWSLIFSRLAFVVTNLHLVAIARTLGIDMMDASYLLSVAGKKAYFNLKNKQKGLSNFSNVSICIFKSWCSVATATPGSKRHPRKKAQCSGWKDWFWS